MRNQELISKLLEGEIDAGGLEELNDWYAKRANGAELPEDIAQRSGEIKAGMWKKLSKEVLAESPEKKTIWKSLVFRTSIAASLALAVLSFALYWMAPVGNERMIVKTNTTAEPMRLTLPDGSAVWLNRNTEIRYRENFSEKRGIVLEKGEAYFDVERDEDKPFTVKSSELVTTVLGTEFNVKTFENGNGEVAVAEGKVKVSGSDSTQEEKGYVLTVGEEVVYDKASDEMRKAVADLDILLCWKREKLVFDGVKLSKAFAMLEVRFGKEIHVVDAEVNDCEIFGMYEDEDLAHILKTMSFAVGFEMEFSERDGTILIKGKGCR
ncbi:iron dicitrate transporter FecR [Fulvitalea axinellae]|uniref:Iron dicitrate transporter FecR n=1 Tax=Fulvitalea axinellae TaxID=1182444 RepID=A0AAU9CH25_9BACT|nr:iron dicitrate transporter FecR [Fulvitalea axinellae]